MALNPRMLGRARPDLFVHRAWSQRGEAHLRSRCRAASAATPTTRCWWRRICGID